MAARNLQENLNTIPSSLAQNLVLKELKSPAVFKGMIDNWQCRNWTLKEWAQRFGEKKLQFRIGPVQRTPNCDPLWETDCSYIQATIDEFVQWQNGEFRTSSDTNESATNLLNIKQEDFWAYADYKHMLELFDSDNDIHNSVDWSRFGFNDRKGQDSTLWIGSPIAHTPCHYDTYGCNLVAQLIGKKRWILFPPCENECLYPTRIPYEESSVFSAVNINGPNLSKFPKFALTSPYVITLEEGDVLFVPHKWWHFVKCLTASVSINSWLNLEIDDERRLEEAVTRTVLSSYMATHSKDDPQQWLNPTEEITPPDVNIEYVKETLKKCIGKSNIIQSKLLEPSEDSSDITRYQIESTQYSKKYSDLPDEKCLKKLRTNSKLEQVLSQFPNHLEVLKPLTFEQFINKTNPISILSTENPREHVLHSLDTNDMENQLKINLLNAVVDPEVVALICEKLKRTYT